MEKLCKGQTNFGTARVVKENPFLPGRGRGLAMEVRHLDALLRWKSLADAPTAPRWQALNILANLSAKITGT